ncbi:Peptidase S8/S53 domain [Sesbania bispinosa]|nr:Peptidase S8/S53 domain [Sesbania bispinosa]
MDYGKDDIISPRDSEGHGTHCASIVAGNSIKSASLYGLASGIARGGVPSARIAVYKPCWSLGCEEADILAAFDEAIADASTIDMKFFTKVRLGDGTIYQGVSVNTFDLKNVSYPLIYAGVAPNITGGYNSSISSSSPKDVAFTFSLPAIHLSENDGELIHSYINSTRGPNAVTPDILKPDLAAPGVDILAAWSPIAPVSRVKGDTRVSNYNILSGTSMACPHATAAAAYVKSFHPNWSPAAIKSALMTTATRMSATLNPEAEFAYGAGQIDPIKAVNPGLVYDVGEIDYVKFLCGQGYDTKKLRTITDDDSSCTPSNNGTAWDLNLPSFTLSTNGSRSFSRIFHRTVTHVGSTTSRYKAKITVPLSSISIKVEPDVLSFSSMGEKKSFTIRINGTINVGMVSSSLVWDDDIFQVRSPIVVYIG